jgi:hypothetical protein
MSNEHLDLSDLGPDLYGAMQPQALLDAVKEIEYLYDEYEKTMDTQQEAFLARLRSIAFDQELALKKARGES